MAAEKFRAAEDAYFTLRGQFDTGRITQQEFEEKMREHMVQDASGYYWMVGADSGKWYYYDGQNWVRGDPLAGPAPVSTTPTRTPASPAPKSQPSLEPTHSPLTPSAATPGEHNVPLLPILLGAGLVLLVVAAFLFLQNRGGIFVAQQPPVPTAAILLQTQTNIPHANTSEPDFFYTETPVPTPSLPPRDIPTRKPRVPLTIDLPTQQASSSIPTITPFVLSTPVSIPASTPSFPPPPSTPPTGRLRVGNGPDARAQYMPVSQFVLDGSLNEWSGDGVLLPIPHFGAENWVGPRDLSATAWLGWNENFLLIAVNVMDDAHVQSQRSWEMFRGDSVELWIDADLEGDFDVSSGNGDDYQFGFSPGDFAGLTPEGVLYIPYRDAIVNQQIFVAAQPQAAGYTLEAAVPWAVLRVQPGQGRVYGYSVDLSDNDVPDTAQQQTQVTHNPNFRFQMPATFGNLILE